MIARAPSSSPGQVTDLVAAWRNSDKHIVRALPRVLITCAKCAGAVTLSVACVRHRSAEAVP
jgi:hypothetical protein